MVELESEEDQDFFSKVSIERMEQDKEWGGQEHDDQHVYPDWLRFIRHQLGSIMIIPGGKPDFNAAMREPNNLLAFERRMVKVAALAMAAVQSARRKAQK